ncbi:hypothetical protein [Sphingobacterium sp. SYP-B4668]|uniref:hypothetical protein n=1 Tax=Sphingobacterium sp. SYP-B4668 TaxID=2996035 RepID=UPI0022DDE11F|nr:hypothetical protein [Sphingobacterium sp. SYP-B4668]
MKIKQDRKAILKKYTNDILIPLDFHDRLAPAVMGLSQFLFDLVEMDTNDRETQQHHITQNGNAIGPLWAALCSREVLRTQRFLKGLHEAIQTLLNGREIPVQVLYAGTGPFATLAIPLMTQYTPSQLQFTLLEINPISFVKMQECISELGLESYIAAYHCCDASTWAVENKQIDIVVSETMYNGLYREPQVSIMLNLLSQLPPTCIAIPKLIQIDLVAQEHHSLPLQSLSSLMTLDRKYMDDIIRHSGQARWQFPSVRVKIPNNPKVKLFLQTNIQIYGNQKLGLNDSSLNLLRQFKIPATCLGHNINIQYQISEIPQFVFSNDIHLEPTIQ